MVGSTHIQKYILNFRFHNKPYLTFLEKNKHLVGLSDWKILFTPEPIDADDRFAEVRSDIFEQTIKVTITTRFLEAPLKQRYEILIHELVHVRLLIFFKMVDQHRAILEEHMVNDITKGMLF